jgi:transposase
MTLIAMGIDLAKNVFAVHGVDEAGKAALVRSSVRQVRCRIWRPARRRA